MLAAAITVEPFGRKHDRTNFHCGIETLDRYLKQQARQDADKRVAAPLVAVSPPGKHILGFYTLSASVLGLVDLPEELARRLPRYPQLPVTLLGRLAVDQSAKGQGLGEHLLLDALHRSLLHADQIAALAVVVEAKSDEATSFYRHYGFMSLQANARRLFLPMGTVAQLLGK